MSSKCSEINVKHFIGGCYSEMRVMPIPSLTVRGKVAGWPAFNSQQGEDMFSSPPCPDHSRGHSASHPMGTEVSFLVLVLN